MHSSSFGPRGGATHHPRARRPARARAGERPRHARRVLREPRPRGDYRVAQRAAGRNPARAREPAVWQRRHRRHRERGLGPDPARARAPRRAGRVEARGASANRERTGAFALERWRGRRGLAPRRRSIAARATTAIPGKAWRDGYEPPHEHEHEVHEGGVTITTTSPSGRLPGSDVHSRGAGAGATWFGSRGFAACGDERLAQRLRHSLARGRAHRDAPGALRVGGQSWSDPLPGFDRDCALRIGHNNYRHDEVESSGEVGTTFRQRGDRGPPRAAARRSPARGTLGVQAPGRRSSPRSARRRSSPARVRGPSRFSWSRRRTLGAGPGCGPCACEREAASPMATLAERDVHARHPSGRRWCGSWRATIGVRRKRARRRSARPRSRSCIRTARTTPRAPFDIGDPRLRKEVSRNVDREPAQGGG